MTSLASRVGRFVGQPATPLRLLWVGAFLVALSLWALGTLELGRQPLPRCRELTCDPFGLSAEDLQLMDGLGLPTGLIRSYFFASTVGIALVFFAIGALVFWRARHSWMGLAASFTLVYLGAVFFTESDDAFRQAYPHFLWVLDGVHGLGGLALTWFLFSFPNGRFMPRSKRWQGLALLVVLLSAPLTILATRPDSWAAPFFLGILGLAIAGQIDRYRRVSGPTERQQTKWVVLGIAAALMVMILWVYAGANFPAGQTRVDRIYFLLPTRLLITVLIPLFPLSIAVSILRYQLFDIDLILNRALVYGALTGMILGLYMLLVGWAGVLLQRDSELAALLLTGVLVVVGLRPARAALQSGVDRLWPARPARPVPAPLATVAPAPGPLAGARLRAARWGWMLLALAAAGVLLASLAGYAAKFGGQLDHAGGGPLPPGARYFAMASGAASLVSALLSMGLALLLYRRRFAEPMAALLSFFLLVYGVVMTGPLEFAAARYLGSADAAQALQGVLLATPMIALLATFPNGRFVPPWTRELVLLSGPFSVGLLLAAPFDAGAFARNPTLLGLMAALFSGLSLAGIYAQVHRYRKVSTPSERRQTRWFVFGFGLWMAYIFLSSGPYFYLTGLPSGAPLPWWGPASELGWWLSTNILPITLTIAITRHQLWDIDLVINRSLVYGSLSAGVVGLYVLTVGGLALLFQSSGNLMLPLLATGLAAVLFQPLRQRLQGMVNRMMYGERDDPAALLARLGEQLEKTGSPEAALKGIVETVAQALRLPYTAIVLGRQGQAAAAYGLPVGAIQTLPLGHQGEVVGKMLVAKRAAGEDLTPKDLRLLETIAVQAGAVVHAARLTEDLRRSRQRLVSAREEERRRLRRDLHDGLGPVLASQGLKLAAAAQLLGEDPAAARRLLEALAVESQHTVAEIRRLVNDLRPSALDDLGLVEAVSDFAAGLSMADGAQQDLTVQVQAPKEGLGPLPAAVEVAAYRIATEALANTARHARASQGVVTFAVKGASNGRSLRLEIVDDGVGLPLKVKHGVGLISMRERAEEVGGSLNVESRPGKGTRVVAVLPLDEEV